MFAGGPRAGLGSFFLCVLLFVVFLFFCLSIFCFLFSEGKLQFWDSGHVWSRDWVPFVLLVVSDRENCNFLDPGHVRWGTHLGTGFHLFFLNCHLFCLSWCCFCLM